MTGSQFLLLVIVGSVAASFGMALSRYLRARPGRKHGSGRRKGTKPFQER
jgi:hypothetical protein